VNDFMPVPTEHKLGKVAMDYYNLWGFPNCIGSLDGKHCQVKCPKILDLTTLNIFHWCYNELLMQIKSF